MWMQGWNNDEDATPESEEHQDLAVFFDQLKTAKNTVSCVWDESLNSGKHTLQRKRIFIAANFKDNAAVLPHLLVQLWHTIALMPKHSIYVSIYESSSRDDTGDPFLQLESYALVHFT